MVLSAIHFARWERGHLVAAIPPKALQRGRLHAFPRRCKAETQTAAPWSVLFNINDMITSSGVKCDVCGKFILPLDPDELVHTFSVAQIPGRKLHADNKCKRAVLDCGGDWQKLPSGPLREAYEEAAAELSNTNRRNEQQ